MEEWKTVKKELLKDPEVKKEYMKQKIKAFHKKLLKRIKLSGYDKVFKRLANE